MPEFLSPEWLAALDESARSSKSLAAAGDFTVQMVIRHSPDGEMTYYVEVSEATARVHGGSLESPDLTLVADYDTAAAISQGTVNAQEALAAGRLKIKGSLELLRGRDEGFAALADVFADVRDTTTYSRPTMPR
jgi:putative sterol carrier protein